MSMPNQMAKSNMLRAWAVVLTSTLFFLYIFIQINLFNSINSELVREFNFSAKQISQLFTSYTYGNILFLFPAGLLLDRFSVRSILLLAFTMSIVATCVFSTFNDFWVMNLARFFIGVGGAFSFLSAMKVASRWFEPRHMALAAGVVVTLGMLGGLIAQTPLTLLTQKFGWRFAIQLVIFFGLALLVLQLMIVRDEPEGSEKLEVAEHLQLEKLGFWHSLGMIVVNKHNWLSGIYISLINLPLFVFGGIWGVPYLTQVHHFSAVEASNIIGMLFIGMMIGSPLSGLISDHMGLRKRPMIIGAILAIAVMLVVMFAPTMYFVAEIALYLVLGIIISSQVIGYPVIAESNSCSVTATATSLGSVLIMSGGLLVQFFGWLLDRSGNAQIVDNVKIYPPADFVQANCLMLVGLVIALVAALLIKETYCKQLNR